MEELDPIISDILQGADLEDGEADFGGPYGVGRWPNAVLMDVSSIDEHQYGYRVGLVFNLKGDSMKYTGRLDLPRTVELNGDEAKNVGRTKANEFTKNILATVLHAAKLLPEGKKWGNVDTDEQYEKLVSLFRAAIGRTMPIEVRVQRRKNKETGKYEDTDFTTIQGLKARK